MSLTTYKRLNSSGLRMLIKRSRLLKGIVFTLLICAVLTIISCDMFQNQSNEQTADLGLTPGEFNLLDTTVHEYLYEKTPILRYTEFAIRYERVDTIIDDVLPKFLLVDAYAGFRSPPVVIRAAFFHGYVKIISEKILDEGF